MTGHVGERALDLLLGALPDHETAALEAHLEGCDACRAELAAAADDVNHLALAVPPVAPSPAVLLRLQASIAPLSERASQWLARLASLADVADEKMRGILASLDDAATWFVGPADGVMVAHVDAGPRCAGAIVGYVRVVAGGVFPEHTHAGEEHVILVQGRYRDSVEGRVYGPGDESVRGDGTSHALHVLEGDDLVYLFVVHGGLSMNDETFGPDSDNI